MKKPKSVVLLNPSQKIIELKPGDIIKLANLVAKHYKNHKCKCDHIQRTMKKPKSVVFAKSILEDNSIEDRDMLRLANLVVEDYKNHKCKCKCDHVPVILHRSGGKSTQEDNMCVCCGQDIRFDGKKQKWVSNDSKRAHKQTTTVRPR